jgi:hypothetical protein
VSLPELRFPRRALPRLFLAAALEFSICSTYVRYVLTAGSRRRRGWVVVEVGRSRTALYSEHMLRLWSGDSTYLALSGEGGDLCRTLHKVSLELAYAQSILTRWNVVPNAWAKAGSSRLSVLVEHMLSLC